MNSDRSQNTTFEESLIDYYLLLKFRIVTMTIHLMFKKYTPLHITKEKKIKKFN